MDVAYCFSRIGVPNQQSKINPWFTGTAFGRRQRLARYTLDDHEGAVAPTNRVGRRAPRTSWRTTMSNGLKEGPLSA
jgi:hypothetical protein